MKGHADILFLSANPTNTDLLELDREARAIQQSLEHEKPDETPTLKLATCWAAEPLDLLREIRSVRPTILHFAGYGAHGEATGIYLQDQGTGEAKLVSAIALRETLAAAGSSIRVVVLSACYSEQQAAGLLEIRTLDCVVGIHGSLGDFDRRVFVREFYRTLAQGRPVSEAFARGWAYLEAQGFPSRKRPLLKMRNGVDVQLGGIR